MAGTADPSLPAILIAVALALIGAVGLSVRLLSKDGGSPPIEHDDPESEAWWPWY